MELKGSKTRKNLMVAFAGESQANRKYMAFAKKAEKEGYKEVAKLFRAAATAETVHAQNHLEVLGQIRDTKTNLEEAISGETHEFKAMYPKMMEEAKEEGNRKAETTFGYASQVEEVHAKLYRKALEKKGNLPETDYHVCSVCGYTAEGEAPEKCPVCGSPKKLFTKID